jgi:hypothetical protein
VADGGPNVSACGLAEVFRAPAAASDIGEWTSLPLTSDTVFTVSVAVTTTGGQPLTAAMSTTVSVHYPALVAGSLVTGTAAVTGDATISGIMTAETIIAQGVGVNGDVGMIGTLTSQGANFSGVVSAGSLAAGAINVAGDLSVAGDLNAQGLGNISAARMVEAQISQDLTVDGQTIVNGVLYAQKAQVFLFSGCTLVTQVQGKVDTTWVYAETDGFAVCQPILDGYGGQGQIYAFGTWFVTMDEGVLTIPVQVGTRWAYAGNHFDVWWLPLGVGGNPNDETLSAVTGPVPAVPAPPISSSSRVGERLKRAETFIEKLSHAFKVPLTDDLKAELAELFLSR